MPATDKYRRIDLFKVFLVLSCLLAVASDVQASNIPRIWRLLHEEVEGREPSWTSTSDAEAWATKEALRLAPIVEEMISGKRADASWATGAFVARLVSSPKIRDLLVQRLEEVATVLDHQPFASSSRDADGAAQAIEVLRHASDERVVRISLELIAMESQNYNVAKQSIIALRALGDTACLSHIMTAPLRKRNDKFDGDCQLAEMIIATRAAGGDFLAGADEQLTGLVETYVAAASERNADGYIKLHRFGLRRVLDATQVQREHFGSKDLEELLLELRKMLTAPLQFVLKPDDLRANLVVGKHFRLEFELEADGWKIRGLERIAR